MLEESNAKVNTGEKGGKGLRVLRRGEKIKFYLDGLDCRFEVEPIVIEGLNHAVNFRIEFFCQQEVSISCTEKKVKLVTGSNGKERLTRLCSAYGKLFPFVIKGRRVDKKSKRYVQVIPAVSLWDVSIYKDAFRIVKCQKCPQPDVGPGPGTSTCGVLVVLPQRHPGVLHGYLEPP